MDIELGVPLKSKKFLPTNRMEITSYGGQVGSQVGGQVGGQEAISEIKLRNDFGKISERK